MSEWPFGDLQRGHYGAILADPPWKFDFWYGDRTDGRKRLPSSRDLPYEVMKDDSLSLLPIAELAAPDCVLFLWTCWPMLERTFPVLGAWGFQYKTCAFCWVKANTQQIDMFRDDADPRMGMGYWTRANSEVCLLATRGKPKRQAADVRQAIIQPLREHSRKPDGIHKRIERLVAGPYVELFCREKRPGWDAWGNETDKFREAAE